MMLRALPGILMSPILLESSATAQVVVPDAVVKMAGKLLPERSNANAAFARVGAIRNLTFTEPSTVRAILLWEHAGYRNTIGWFTWREDSGAIEVTASDLLYDDVSMPPRQRGDDAVLRNADGSVRTFAAGENLGFFVIADGARTAASLVRNWTHSGSAAPALTPAGNKAIGRGCYTSVDGINPEAASGDGSESPHVAMFHADPTAGFVNGRSFFLLGFEDLNRTVNADNDFNDAVIAIDVMSGAASTTNVVTTGLGDPDGDGIHGVNDRFPNDGTRAWVRRQPARGLQVLAFEDLYPISGDSDFNDAVFAWQAAMITGTGNRVKDVVIDFHLVARGATYDHEFGLRIAGLPGSATGTVQIQRFMSGDTVPSEIEVRSLSDVIHLQNRQISGVFESTQQALPRLNLENPFANTPPGQQVIPAASSRVVITFDVPVRSRDLGRAPFDPYLVVTPTEGPRADVHLPGMPALPNRDATLPIEREGRSFVGSNGLPWAISLPTSWRFPLEGVQVKNAYPEFETWRQSNGKRAKKWFRNPTTEPDMLSVPIGDLIPARRWTLFGPLNGG